MSIPFFNFKQQTNNKNNTDYKIIKYTLDIDTYDKLIPTNIPKNFNYKEIEKLINPYTIEIFFGKNNQTFKFNNSSFFTTNCYMNEDFKNIKYIKILNCIFPKVYNFNSTSYEKKITDLRFIILRLDCDCSNSILSTNSEFNKNCIKLKLKYCPDPSDKFVILEPLTQEEQYLFKDSDLKKLDRIKITLFDDEYKPLTLILNDEIIDLNCFIKEHSVNFNIEIGVYKNEINSSINF